MHMTIYLLVRLVLQLLLTSVAFKLQLERLPVEMFFNVGTEWGQQCVKTHFSLITLEGVLIATRIMFKCDEGLQ